VAAGCGSGLEDGGIPLRGDAERGILRVVDVKRQPYPGVLLGMEEEQLEGTGDYLLVSFELENRRSTSELLVYDQLAVGWEDRFVTYKYVDEASIEVPEGETGEFELTYPLSEIETVDAIESSDDLRLLYNEEISPGFPRPVLGGPGDLEEAEDLAEKDVALSELWDGTFDD
jgi:hypothetical protein